MADLQCEVQSLKINQEGGAPAVFTVGEVFNLVCQGETLNLHPKSLKVQWKDQEYALQILNSEINPQGKYILHVVSYKVGQYNHPAIEITDGVNTASLKNLSWEVKSVIDPQKPPQGPFGPFGPFQTEFPWGGIWLFSGILFLFLLSLLVKLWRLHRVRQWQQRIKKLDSPLAPSAQLYALIRQIERQVDYHYKGQLTAEVARSFLAQLEQGLKVYIARSFQIPATEWSAKLVLQNLKEKYFWLGQETLQQYLTLNTELSQMQNPKKNQPNTQDTVQLLKNTKKWVDRTVKAVNERDVGTGTWRGPRGGL